MCACDQRRGYFGCGTKLSVILWVLYGFLTCTGLVLLIMGASKLPACPLSPVDVAACETGSEVMLYGGLTLALLGQAIVVYLWQCGKPPPASKHAQVQLHAQQSARLWKASAPHRSPHPCHTAPPAARACCCAPPAARACCCASRCAGLPPHQGTAGADPPTHPPTRRWPAPAVLPRSSTRTSSTRPSRSSSEDTGARQTPTSSTTPPASWWRRQTSGGPDTIPWTTVGSTPASAEGAARGRGAPAQPQHCACAGACPGGQRPAHLAPGTLGLTHCRVSLPAMACSGQRPQPEAVARQAGGAAAGLQPADGAAGHSAVPAGPRGPAVRLCAADVRAAGRGRFPGHLRLAEHAMRAFSGSEQGRGACGCM